MEKNRTSSISHSNTIAELAEFWDTHDVTDFEDQTREVDIKFDLHTRHHYIAIDRDLLIRLENIAQERGIGVESLANIWLQERALSTNS